MNRQVVSIDLSKATLIQPSEKQPNVPGDNS